MEKSWQFPSPFPNPRNKPFLFYFNIVKCASPLVLLEFQCPTPQVTSPLSSCFLSPTYISQVLLPPLVVASLPALFLLLMNKGEEGGTSVLRGHRVSVLTPPNPCHCPSQDLCGEMSQPLPHLPECSCVWGLRVLQAVLFTWLPEKQGEWITALGAWARAGPQCWPAGSTACSLLAGCGWSPSRWRLPHCPHSQQTLWVWGPLGSGGAWGGFRGPPDWSHLQLRIVAQRCFPAVHAHKGVLMVGNETTYEDGLGSRKNVTELVEGAKWGPQPTTPALCFLGWGGGGVGNRASPGAGPIMDWGPT